MSHPSFRNGNVHSVHCVLEVHNLIAFNLKGGVTVGSLPSDAKKAFNFGLLNSFENERLWTLLKFNQILHFAL